jgi:hypothetical protein
MQLIWGKKIDKLSDTQILYYISLVSICINNKVELQQHSTFHDLERWLCLSLVA